MALIDSSNLEKLRYLLQPLLDNKANDGQYGTYTKSIVSVRAGGVWKSYAAVSCNLTDETGNGFSVEEVFLPDFDLKEDTPVHLNLG